MRKTICIIAVAGLLSIAAPTNADQKEEREKAIAFFKNFKGDFKTNNENKKLPVVSLDLIQTKVKDADLANLKDIPDLTHLNLGGTKITDKGLEHLKACPDLRFLSLAGTKVTDKGLEIVVPFVPDLEHFMLDDTAITYKGLGYLKKLESLKHLDLRKVPKVTKKGVDDFTKALPKCRTFHEP